MTLTQEQKVAIATAYAPILYLHSDERFVPVKPEMFIRRAALWQGQPPSDSEQDWGLGSPGTFPRQPTIPKGGIGLDPSDDTEGTVDTDGDGVAEWYLGHKRKDGTRPYLSSTEQHELWLDLAGWQDSQVVTADSTNSHCNSAGAVAYWEETGLGRWMTDWYHVEVSELDDLKRLLIALGKDSVEEIIRSALGDAWVIWYYFLYPVHEEHLKRCEQVFDVADRGDYEGDWNAIGIVVPKPLVLPWDAPGAPFPDPSHVAFGVRLRGLSKEVAPSLAKQGMLIRSWEQVGKLALHTRVFVANGYHNNYAEPGDHDPPQVDLLGIPVERLTCEVTNGIDQAVTDVKEALEDIKETIGDVSLTIAKWVAGAGIGMGIGGPAGATIGALAGGLSGLAEALSTSDTDNSPSKEAQRQLEREPGPPSGHYGTVLKPFDVTDPLLEDSVDPTKKETATSVRDWLGTDADRLVDYEHQLWWPTNLSKSGYDGRWGVRCTDDPNQRRSGIAFPDFRAALLNDLAVHLAKTH